MRHNQSLPKNPEWIIWSPKGYYNASVGGAQYVGFHINRGADKEAYFVTADKYPELYRPDVIDLIIQGHSEYEAIKIASKKRRVHEVDVTAQRPPILNLLSLSNIKTLNDEIEIKFSIDSPTEIKKIIVTKNGAKISKRTISRAKKSGNTQKIKVQLDSGENIITISAKNRFAVSDPLIIRAIKESTQRENIFKPNLYLLAVGVSKYKNSDYNLQFADIDAKSVAELFKSQEGKLYKKVVVKALLNGDATVDNVTDGLSWVEKEATQRDVVVIFLAGHGENDSKGNYYFLTHDTNLKRLRRTALKWNKLKDTVEALPSKVILLADTCHSGNITGSGRRRDITGALKSLLESGAGAVVMSATTGRGYSIEKPEWGHGAFTKALIEGLGDKKADYNQNGVISLKEIDLYITDRVKSLTDGEQKPTTKIPESMPDFPIVVK